MGAFEGSVSTQRFSESVEESCFRSWLQRLLCQGVLLTAGVRLALCAWLLCLSIFFLSMLKSFVY